MTLVILQVGFSLNSIIFSISFQTFLIYIYFQENLESSFNANNSTSTAVQEVKKSLKYDSQRRIKSKKEDLEKVIGFL